MQSDYRVKKLVTEDGGDVVAICYDVLYGETFEKYIGIPDDFDARENASNLLQDSNYEISDEIRAELESTFGVAEFDDDQDYDGYQFYDFGDDEWEDDEDEFEDEEFTIPTNLIRKHESFNLREALNTIDINTYNKYDLLNLYEACDLSENEKRALANIVYDQNDPSVIYDTLNNRFVGNKEIEMPERVKDGVIHEAVKDYNSMVNQLAQMLGHNMLDATISLTDANDLVDLLCKDFGKEKEEVLNDVSNAQKNYRNNKNESKSVKEDIGAKTFSQWFDETQHYGDDDEFYPFSNYIKKFPNAEILKDATAEDIKNNAHRFYNIYDVDSVDREKAFHFASEELGIDYDDFYYAWMNDQPMKGVNESVDEFEFDDEFNAYYDGYTSELTDEEKYLLLMAQDMGEYGDNSNDYDGYEDEVRRVETKAQKIAKAKGITLDDYISILDKNFDYNLKDGSYKFNESKESDDTLPKAVELLYIMDKFVLDVYDNESWLMNGIPDGEFNEGSADSAKQNWKDHSWLVIDENGNANLDDFREFVDVFRRCTRSKNYDQEERNRIIAEAESLLHN